MTLILFDVDGTLVYSDKLDSLAFAQTYTEIYQRDFPSIDWSTYPHVTDDTIFATVIQQHFGRPVRKGEMRDFRKPYMDRLVENRRQNPHHFKEVAGAAQLLAYLQSHETYQVAVATGGWSEPAHLKLKHVGINTASMVLIGADGKNTREEILEHAIRDIQQQYPGLKRTVYIGDAPWDVKTTQNLELNFVGVRYRHDFEVLEQLGARHVVGNYLDVEHFMEQIEQAQAPQG